MKLPATGQAIRGVRVRQGQALPYRGTVDYVSLRIGGRKLTEPVIILKDGGSVWPGHGDTWEADE